MKFNLDRLSLLLIPYLLLASICYSSGYWSNVKIDIFNYYQVQDILKGLANPLFGFAGLAFYPLVTGASILASWQKKHPESSKLSWPEFDEEEGIGERIATYLLVFLALILLLVVLLTIIGLFVATISAILFPIEDLYSFIRLYTTTLCWVDCLRLGALLFLGPVIAAWSVKDHVQKPAINVASLIGCTILPLVIAYHFGKMESYKVLTGMEFRYLEAASGPLKYLGKADTHYFFSEDRGYVPYQTDSPTHLVNDTFEQTIRIISADSLKQLSLRRYSSLQPVKGGPKGFVARH